MIGQYDKTSKKSIYDYARKLEGKTFNQICNEDEYFLSEVVKEVTAEEYLESYEDKKRKGGLGEIVEERYFHYKADNEARADFPEAKVELKVTPYKVNKNGTISSKERVSVTMIDYMKIVDTEFYDSNAWEKLENILLVYYLWNPEVEDRLDYMINYVYMLSPEGEDLEIIKNDYYKIQQKIIDGKAHELSEGDTLYLGAATKSSDSKQLKDQPFSEIKAKPRAFSLKNSYMTYVLRNYIDKDYEPEDKIVKSNNVTDFEQYVIDKINEYKGILDEDLFKKFFGCKKVNSKSKYSLLAYKILGVRTKNAEEFEKANIKVKAIRLEENGKMKESMSLPRFKILDLIEQEWEESDIYTEFSETKYLFIIYQKLGSNYYLKGSQFWNMPVNDLEVTVKEEWKKARDIFRNGVELTHNKSRKVINNNLPKLTNTYILHVRPHTGQAAYLINGIKYGNGKLESDSDLLPNGDRMTIQSFWLNNKYIIKQLNDENK